MRVRRAMAGASISCFVAFWPILACARDDEAALKSRILREFPTALKALEGHFGSAVGSVKYLDEHGIGHPRHLRVEGTYTFASKRPYWAMVTSGGMKRTAFGEQKSAGKKDSEVGKKGPEVSTSGKEVVYCYNNVYNFNLTRNDGSSQYAIKSFDKNVNGEPPHPVKVQVYGQLYQYLDAPFSFTPAERPLSSIFSSDLLSIQHVSEVRQDGENCLKIDVRLGSGMWKIAKGRPSPQYDGWIVVAPEKRWVLRDYELSHGGVVIRGHVEYGDPRDGFPIPKHVSIKAFLKKSNAPIYLQDYIFEELRFVDAPDREFTLAAFGLPDLGEPGRSRSRYPNPVAFWLLGAAVVSLVVSIALRHYFVTPRRTPP